MAEDSKNPRISPQDIERLRSFANLLEASEGTSAGLLDITRGIKTELREQLGVKQKLSDQDRSILSLSNSIEQSQRLSSSYLRRSGQLRQQLNKEAKIEASLNTEISSVLFNNNLNRKEYLLNAAKLRDVDQEILSLSLQQESISKDLLTATNQERVELERELTTVSRLLALKEADKKILVDSIPLEQQKLGTVLKLSDSIAKLRENRTEELVVAKEVNRALGIAGALLDNLNKIGVRFLGGLGLNLGSFNEAVAEGTGKMQDLAEAFAQSTLLSSKFATESKNIDRFANTGLKALQDYVGLNEDTVSISKELVNSFSKTKDEITSLLNKQALLEKSGEALNESERKRLEQLKLINSEQLSIGKGLIPILDAEKRIEFKNAQNALDLIKSELRTIREERELIASNTSISDEIRKQSLEDLDQRTLVLLEAQKDSLDIQRDLSGEAFEQSKTLNDYQKRWAAFKQALPDIKSALIDAVNDPVALGTIAATQLVNLTSAFIKNLKKAFLEVSSAAAETARLTGRTDIAFASINSRTTTTVDNLKTIAALTQEIGLDAGAIFSGDQIAQISEATKLLGLSAEQTTSLALRSQQTGVAAEQLTDQLLLSAKNTNSLNRTAVAAGAALRDALSTSDGIALSFGQSVEALGEAATLAKALGMSLQDVDKIAGSLLNFESSIEAELEAQLLTGRNINLAKARELALSNDLAGVAQELANQNITGAEYANMNRIQQESLAKALGMSRDELAKMIIAQDTQNNLTEEQRRKILGVSEEEFKRLSIQDRLNVLADKFLQSFTPLLEIGVDLAVILGNILEPLSKGIALVTSLASKLSENKILLAAITGYFGLMYAGMLRANIVSWAASSANAIRGLSSAFTLANGNILKMIGLDKVLAGTKALVSGALTLVNGLFGTNFTLFNASTSATVANTAATQVNTAVKNKNAAASTRQAVATARAGQASATASKGISSLGVGLAAFAAAAAPAVPVLLGIGAALLLAAPAFFAISKAVTGLAAVIGNVLIKGLEMLPSILESTASGLSKLLQTVTPGNLIGLFALGPALLSASTGLTAISAAMTGARLLGLNKTGRTEESSGTIETNTVSNKEENISELLATKLEFDSTQNEILNRTNQQILNTLNELVSTVKSGGNVNIDGNKLQEAFILGSFKT